MNVIRTWLAALLFLSLHATVFAYGGLWIARDAALCSMKKLVLFPMSVSDDLNDFAVNADESSAVFRQNDYLHRRLSKKAQRRQSFAPCPRHRRKARPHRSRAFRLSPIAGQRRFGTGGGSPAADDGGRLSRAAFSGKQRAH